MNIGEEIATAYLQSLTSYNHREHIIPNYPLKFDLSI